ncbi:MAG TPA: hypothetical protein PK029_02230 [Bacteroidales bacterium]|mgnify:CR=1 FL=1|nr:MAG: hypothetical protein BWY22_00730 [Bacteroidetes bacterium ADurb.Bin217]HPH15960.1 hypothetical protein [Bacteroidales bacterium]HPM13158.1 hypothetical protein [Bacteroidales bacterium]
MHTLNLGKTAILFCILISLQWNSVFSQKDSTFKNYNFFGVKIDMTAWGTMPILYFNFGEYELYKTKKFSHKIMPYALEITGYENEPINNQANTVYLDSYFAHNVCSYIFERYFITPSKLMPRPKMFSLYGKANHSVFTFHKYEQKETHTTIKKSFYYSPYLETGVKLYIGNFNKTYNAGIYWSTLSIGYIMGSNNVHKIAKSNGNGFFINYEFCIGLLSNYLSYIAKEKHMDYYN